MKEHALMSLYNCLYAFWHYFSLHSFCIHFNSQTPSTTNGITDFNTLLVFSHPATATAQEELLKVFFLLLSSQQWEICQLGHFKSLSLKKKVKVKTRMINMVVHLLKTEDERLIRREDFNFANCKIFFFL